MDNDPFDEKWRKGDCNWSDSPSDKIEHFRGRYREFLLPETLRYARALQEKTEAITALLDKNARRIEHSAKTAYESLESVVHSLLLIEEGDKRLSRQSSTIIDALESTATNFSDLSKVSEENILELGVKSGDCMELGDSVGCFLDNLKAKILELNNYVSAVLEQEARQTCILEESQQREHSLELECQRAKDAASGFWMILASIFDDSVMPSANARVSSAVSALDNNRREQEKAQVMSSHYRRLAMTTRDLRADMSDLQRSVEDLLQKFRDEYDHATDEQSAETRLYRGLLDLRNQIMSGDWTTTRDHALQVVLRLLAADDAVFMRSSYYEDVEERIKASIAAKLGGGAVQKLLHGVVTDAEELDSALEY